jgi:hypothetical protein
MDTLHLQSIFPWPNGNHADCLSPTKADRSSIANDTFDEHTPALATAFRAMQSTIRSRRKSAQNTLAKLTDSQDKVPEVLCGPISDARANRDEGERAGANGGLLTEAHSMASRAAWTLLTFPETIAAEAQSFKDASSGSGVVVAAAAIPSSWERENRRRRLRLFIQVAMRSARRKGATPKAVGASGISVFPLASAGQHPALTEPNLATFQSVATQFYAAESVGARYLQGRRRLQRDGPTAIGPLRGVTLTNKQSGGCRGCPYPCAALDYAGKAPSCYCWYVERELASLMVFSDC